jgi:hypothetical protein
MGDARLPVPRQSAPSPAPPFPIGSLVRLRQCPGTAAGTVVGFKRRKVFVNWRDLNYIGKHSAASLLAIQTRKP